MNMVCVESRGAQQAMMMELSKQNGRQLGHCENLVKIFETSMTKMTEK